MEEFSYHTIYVETVIFVIALFMCALFSFLETSITALRLFKLKEIAKTTRRYRALFLSLEKNPHRVLSTILIANSLANTTAAALITDVMESLFHHWHLSSGLAFPAGIGLATTCILIFGEIIPKNMAKMYGERLFRSTLWITNLAYYALYPFVTFLMKLSNFFIYRLFGKKHVEGTESITSEKEIQFLINYINEKGIMDQEKTEMLQSIFKIGRTPVKEIMIPAIDIVSISSSASLQEALDIFSKYQYSRLPLYEGKPDNIIGMIHQKDIFLLVLNNEKKPLKEIARPIMFTPENVKVNQLLREFREKRMHIAVVINEHGSLTGLVTLEDVLEEIVGEISDEHEDVTQKITPIKEGGWLVDASVNLDDLEDVIKITFETEDAITLAGFLTEQLQHLPKKGERIFYKDFYFQVQKASPKRVYQVLIFEDKEPESTENL